MEMTEAKFDFAFWSTLGLALRTADTTIAPRHGPRAHGVGEVGTTRGVYHDGGLRRKPTTKALATYRVVRGTIDSIVGRTEYRFG